MIACISAMMKRKNRLGILKNLKVPILLIAGRKDELISCNKAEETAKELKNLSFSILENSGHVGMIEESGKMLKKIKKFLV
jgi:pimeloyl-ACP methyl ester carboxylesterase